MARGYSARGINIKKNSDRYWNDVQTGLVHNKNGEEMLDKDGKTIPLTEKTYGFRNGYIACSSDGNKLHAYREKQKNESQAKVETQKKPRTKKENAQTALSFD